MGNGFGGGLWIVFTLCHLLSYQPLPAPTKQKANVMIFIN